MMKWHNVKIFELEEDQFFDLIDKLAYSEILDIIKNEAFSLKKEKIQIKGIFFLVQSELILKDKVNLIGFWEQNKRLGKHVSSINLDFKDYAKQLFLTQKKQGK